MLIDETGDGSTAIFISDLLADYPNCLSVIHEASPDPNRPATTIMTYVDGAVLTIVGLQKSRHNALCKLVQEEVRKSPQLTRLEKPKFTINSARLTYQPGNAVAQPAAAQNGKKEVSDEPLRPLTIAANPEESK